MTTRGKAATPPVLSNPGGRPERYTGPLRAVEKLACLPGTVVYGLNGSKRMTSHITSAVRSLD